MPLYNLTSNKQLLFLHIPKTAGTSIIDWLDRHTNVSWKSKIGMHNSFETLDAVSSKQYSSFTVVRNPWDRIVSNYVFLEPRFRKFLGTFEEFIHKLKDPCFSLGEPRFFRPQTEWITLPIDHILKYENLSQDFKIIQDYVGKYEPLPILNTTEHKRYQDYFNDTTKKIIEEVYKSDIEKFDYTFNG